MTWYEKIKERPIFWGLVRLTIGLWALHLSCLYMSSTGELASKITMQPDMLIYIMFAAIVAFVYFNYCSMFDFFADKLHTYAILIILGDLFAYAAFFNIVLFPLSGFGIIEWGLVTYMFIGSLLVKRSSYNLFSPVSLLITGIALYVVKVFVQSVFPVNIYQEVISGNTTIRMIIFCIAAIFGVKFLLGLFQREQQLPQPESSFMKPVNAVIAVGNKLFTAGLMVSLIGIALIGFVVTFFAARKMEAEFWNAIGPTLEKLLTTDNMRIIESDAQFFFQIAAFLIFFIYFILNDQTMKACIKQRADDFREFIKDRKVQEKLGDHYLQDDFFLAVQGTQQFHTYIEKLSQPVDELKQ